MTEYRVVWEDRYFHASYPTMSEKDAETFAAGLRGVSYRTEIQRRDTGLGVVGTGPWQGVCGECEDQVDELRGPSSWWRDSLSHPL